MKADRGFKFVCNGCGKGVRNEDLRMCHHVSICGKFPSVIQTLGKELYGVAMTKANEKKAMKSAESEREVKSLRNRVESVKAASSGSAMPPAHRVALGTPVSTVVDLSSDVSSPIRRPGAPARNHSDSGGTGKSTEKSKLTHFGFNVVSADLQRQLNQAVFEHILLSNHPFTESSSRSFRRIFSIGMPGYKPPSSQHIGGYIHGGVEKNLDGNSRYSVNGRNIGPCTSWHR
jgi:hypothetical protein